MLYAPPLAIIDYAPCPAPRDTWLLVQLANGRLLATSYETEQECMTALAEAPGGVCVKVPPQ